MPTRGQPSRTYHLEDLRSHALPVGHYVVPAALRLAGNWRRWRQSAEMRVSLRNIESGDREETLVIKWEVSAQEARNYARFRQAHDITEEAAIAVAFLLMPLTGWEVVEVATEGAGFDFWVESELRREGLEVSGLVRGSLEGRHRVKAAQLMGSRHKVNGFVAVVKFLTRQAILAFHTTLP
jgi:hypothetical protein